MSKDVENLRKHERVLNHIDIIKNKLSSNTDNKIKVGLLEFHPYDCCPLSCLYCTYHRDKSAVYPFDKMDKLKVFDPRAIVVSGGGEPVYYNDGKYKFNDVIHKLREMFPNAKIGVTSNGQYMPEGDWQKEVEWIRVSLDTDNEQTFKKIKDGSLKKSLETLEQLIQGPIKYVGAGFVYSRFNIDEVYNFLKMIYKDIYLKYQGKGAEKLNIQFRPTCMVSSCNCPSESYLSTGQLMVPDNKDWWKESVEKERKLIFDDKDEKFKEFVLNHANVDEKELFVVNNKEPKFEKCWLSLIRALVRANGDIFPCVMRACNNAKPIENILTCNNLENIYLGQMLYHNLKDDYCKGCEACCRIDGQKNVILDKNFDKAEEIINDLNSIDYFF